MLSTVKSYIALHDFTVPPLLGNFTQLHLKNKKEKYTRRK